MLVLNLLPLPVKIINELLWKAVLHSSHYYSNSKFETSPSNCANSKPFHSCRLLFPPPKGLVIITAGVCSSQQCLPTFIFHSHSDAEHKFSKRERGGGTSSVNFLYFTSFVFPLIITFFCQNFSMCYCYKAFSSEDICIRTAAALSLRWSSSAWKISIFFKNSSKCEGRSLFLFPPKEREINFSTKRWKNVLPFLFDFFWNSLCSVLQCVKWSLNVTFILH